MDIKIQPNSKVNIINVKVGFRCVECGREWGVYLHDMQFLPPHGDVCIDCKQKKMDETFARFDAQVGK